MNEKDLLQYPELLQQDLQDYLRSPTLKPIWFRAAASTRTEIDGGYKVETWLSALVPAEAVPGLLIDEGWDVDVELGFPYAPQPEEDSDGSYLPYGNLDGFEPIVIWRSFSDLRPDYFELAQEFRLFHNLYHDVLRSRYIIFDTAGNEEDACRYSTDHIEIRADLLHRFCTTKQMALASYVVCNTFLKGTLSDYSVEETRHTDRGQLYSIRLYIGDHSAGLKGEPTVLSRILGKKYVLPRLHEIMQGEVKSRFQEFIIGSAEDGSEVQYSCDPDKLSDYFSNRSAPHYLTPVFFRAEVLSKYYDDTDKYSVDSGAIRCGSLWSISIDNDNNGHVMVWLGDLGRDLPGSERHHWRGYNVHPHDLTISDMYHKQQIEAQFAGPKRLDFVFKERFTEFRTVFHERYGWNLFLPLHKDDEHVMKGLHVLATDNQAHLEKMVLALTKVLIDSINEAKVTENVTTLADGDKGITKLEKFFAEKGLPDYENHIQLLRTLQDYRSKSAAHRKGKGYEKLAKDLQISEVGRVALFNGLLSQAISFIDWMKVELVQT